MFLEQVCIYISTNSKYEINKYLHLIEITIFWLDACLNMFDFLLRPKLDSKTIFMFLVGCTDLVLIYRKYTDSQGVLIFQNNLIMSNIGKFSIVVVN